MQKTVWIRRLALVGALALILSGCTSLYEKHGYTPSQQELDNIVVGVDSRDTLADTIGAPTTSSLIQQDAWYYVESLRQTRGFFAPKPIKRNVVTISFDPGGIVSNVEILGLEDGRVVTLNRRVSDDNIKGVSFLRQLLGNIGNFTADQFLGQ